jgi:hypothetical protein
MFFSKFMLKLNPREILAVFEDGPLRGDQVRYGHEEGPHNGFSVFPQTGS